MSSWLSTGSVRLPTRTVFVVSATAVIVWSCREPWARYVAPGKLAPIEVGKPFPVIATSLEGDRLGFSECTSVIVMDAFCPGCRSAAHDWEPAANRPEPKWLLVNKRHTAREFERFYLATPRDYYVADAAARSTSKDLLARLGIGATPTTVFVKPDGTVSGTALGIAREPICTGT